MTAQEIEQKIKQLPKDLIEEVGNFIDLLLKKHHSSQEKAGNDDFKFDWEGGLAKLKQQYTSVELQHESMEWR